MHQQCNRVTSTPFKPYNHRVSSQSQTGTASFTPSQRILVRTLPLLASWLIRVLGATLRMDEVLADGAHPADRDSNGGLYPFWHNCLLLAAYRYRNLGIRILISPSFDGELIARTVAHLGFVPVRGSSSRGGAAGLLALSRALAAGHKCAITADGPRGPVYIAKPGAAAIATNAANRQQSGGTRGVQREDASSAAQTPHSAATQDSTQDTGAGTGSLQVSAFYLHPDRAWKLRSWDGFLIPKPFSRVTVAWAQPLPLGTQHLPQALQSALDEVTAAAQCPTSTRPR